MGGGRTGGGGGGVKALGILRKGRERIWHVCHIGEIITDEEISSLGTFRASIYSHLSTRFSRRLSGPGPGTTESSGGVEGGGGEGDDRPPVTAGRSRRMRSGIPFVSWAIR